MSLYEDWQAVIARGKRGLPLTSKDLQIKAAYERQTFGTEQVRMDEKIRDAPGSARRLLRMEIPFGKHVDKDTIKRIRYRSGKEKIKSRDMSADIQGRTGLFYETGVVQDEHGIAPGAGKGKMGDTEGFTPTDLIGKDSEGTYRKVVQRGSDSAKTRFPGSGRYNVMMGAKDSFTVEQISNLYKPTSWLEAVVDDKAFGDTSLIDVTNEDWLRLQQGLISDDELIAHKFRVKDEAMKGNVWVDAVDAEDQIAAIHKREEAASKKKHYNRSDTRGRTERSWIKADKFKLTKLKGLHKFTGATRKADIVAQLGLNVTTGNIAGSFVNAAALSTHLIGESPRAQKVVAELTVKIAQMSGPAQKEFRRQLIKIAGKQGAKSAAKLVPGVDIIMSGREAWSYLKEGKLDQAGIATLSGAVGWISGPGDFAAALLDATNTAIDIKRELDFSGKEDVDTDKKKTPETKRQKIKKVKYKAKGLGDLRIKY